MVRKKPSKKTEMKEITYHSPNEGTELHPNPRKITKSKHASFPNLISLQHRTEEHSRSNAAISHQILMLHWTLLLFCTVRDLT